MAEAGFEFARFLSDSFLPATSKGNKLLVPQGEPRLRSDAYYLVLIRQIGRSAATLEICVRVVLGGGSCVSRVFCNGL